MISIDPASIEALILCHLGAMRQRDPATIDPQQPFNELGIDSVEAISLTEKLEVDLGIAIDPVTIREHPSPHAFAEHLATRSDET